MLTVHHLGISQSDRIVWLCEELEIPYALKLYARDPVTRLAPAEYKALSPFETAPVITDGDLTLGESGAIIEYLCGKHGGGRLLLGPEDAGYADFLFWFHFANGSMLPAGMTDMISAMLGASPDALRQLRSRSDRSFQLVERRLGEAMWFAGEAFTAADVIMLFPLTTMRVFAPRDISGYPNLLAYLQRVGERPAFQRAMAKADPGFTPMLT